MAGIRFFPEDWAAMFAGVHEWTRDNIPPDWVSVWGRQNAPAPGKPYVFITMLVPPVYEGQGDGAAGLFKGTGVIIRNVLNLTEYVVTINGVPLSFTSSAAATRIEIRDGLVAAINAGGEPVTAAPLTLSAGPADSRDILNVTDDGDASAMIVEDTNLRLKQIQATESEGNATFSIGLIGRSSNQTPAVYLESVAVLGNLKASLRTSVVLELLRGAGWSVISTEGERKPDVVSGSKWEDRSGFDVRLRCRYRDLRAVDFIESAPLGSSIVGSLTH